MSNFEIVKGEKQLNALNKRALSNYQKGRELVWQAAVSCVSHAKETGDTRKLVSLLDGMGQKSQARSRVAAAIRQLCIYKDSEGKDKCAFNVRIDKDGKVIAKLASNQETRTHINVEALANTWYWELIEANNNVQAPFELEKRLISLIKKAHENNIDDKAIQNTLVKALAAVKAA